MGRAALSAICSSSSGGSEPSVAPPSRRAARCAARAARLSRGRPLPLLPACRASRCAARSNVCTACLKASGQTACASVLQLPPRATSTNLQRGARGGTHPWTEAASPGIWTIAQQAAQQAPPTAADPGARSQRAPYAARTCGLPRSLLAAGRADRMGLGRGPARHPGLEPSPAAACSAVGAGQGGGREGRGVSLLVQHALSVWQRGAGAAHAHARLLAASTPEPLIPLAHACSGPQRQPSSA